jgi:hypothetical protein
MPPKPKLWHPQPPGDQNLNRRENKSEPPADECLIHRANNP